MPTAASPPCPPALAPPLETADAPPPGPVPAFAGNVRALFLGGIGTGAVRGIRSVVLSRLLGPAGYGLLDLAIFFSRSVASLSRIGLADATVRFGAGLDAPRARAFALRAAAAVALAAAAFAPLGALLAAPALGRVAPHPALVAAAAFAAIPPIAVGDVARAYLLARQNFATPARIGFATALASFALEAAALLAGLGVPGVLAASLLASVGALAAYARAWRNDREKGGPGSTAPAVSEVARYAAARFALGALTLVTWTRFEVVFLGALWSASEVAFYALPFGVVGAAVELVPGSISAVLPAAYPERRARGGEAAAAELYGRAFFQMAAVGLPLAAIGALLARPLVSLVFSERYLPSAPVVGILAVGAVLSIVSSAASHLILSSSKAPWMLLVAGAGAAANLALDFAWIPRGGALGASWANTTAQVFESAVVVGAAAALFGAKPPLRRLAALLPGLAACAGVGALGARLFQENAALCAGLCVPAMAAAYFFVGRATGVFRGVDREVLRALVPLPGVRPPPPRA